ncbi:histone-lysine N-methyltransferase SETMAR [Plakobranchus ocellatus]|uniref:Histone-lysine N-methyltransferase SETMAR n=1 Tax=Plakobranchus ocellatus TaxID=259542 RepID=A0AAV4CBX6_9GAST|nr:histone-lysine N-methyltransferase SETMAR [Plakobranchus ocellatus]
MSKRITPFASRYCSTLDRLKEAIRRKRSGLWRRGVVFQHDNATPHSANLTQQWLQRYGWEILPHPAHSPDLAPSDFHLFGPLKRHLRGIAFETEDDLISELRNWVISGSGSPSGRDAGNGAWTYARRAPADLRAVSLPTAPPKS